MLLELRRGARAEAVMAAVVCTRRDLVDKKAALPRHEQLDGHHADVPERGGNASAESLGLRCDLRRDSSRHAARPENVAAVHVLGDWMKAHVAVEITCEQDGDFFLEVDERLEDRGGSS